MMDAVEFNSFVQPFLDGTAVSFKSGAWSCTKGTTNVSTTGILAANRVPVRPVTRVCRKVLPKGSNWAENGCDGIGGGNGHICVADDPGGVAFLTKCRQIHLQRHHAPDFATLWSMGRSCRPLHEQTTAPY